MFRRFLAAFLLLSAIGVAGVLLAEPAKTEMVSYKSGDETVQGFLATPGARGKFPAIVVIHEWWGLNDWVKEETQKLADQGYVALAVDLYRGKVAANSDEAHELMRGLPQDRGTRDLKAAFDYLASRKDVDKNKIGSIGWCMGGSWSMQFAVAEPRLAACVVNYGALPTDRRRYRENSRAVSGKFRRGRSRHSRGCNQRLRKNHESRRQISRRKNLRWRRPRLRKSQ